MFASWLSPPRVLKVSGKGAQEQVHGVHVCIVTASVRDGVCVGLNRDIDVMSPGLLVFLSV